MIMRGAFATVVPVITVARPRRDRRHPASIANAARRSVNEVPSTARDGPVDQPFDYFPDHFANQAKEPAEPIASF
jgi:hypothetical protein